MQTILRKRFTAAVQNFLRSEMSSGKFSSKGRARVFIEHESELCRMFLMEETERIMRHEEHMADRPREENVYQMFLPGFSGLTEKLPLKTGKVALAKATVTTLEEAIVVIRKKVARHPNITRLDSLIGGMRPYLEDYPGLTVERYCELRAAGIEAGAGSKVAKARV